VVNFILSYDLLTNETERLITDQKFIETAILLEEKSLVRCVKEDDGIRVSLNLDGNDFIEIFKNSCRLNASIWIGG
jgi:hypothetical protein